MKAVVVALSDNCFTLLDDGDRVIDKPLRFLRSQAFDRVTIAIRDNVSAVPDHIGGEFTSVEHIVFSGTIADVLKTISREDTENGILFVPGDSYFTHPQTTVSFLPDHSHLMSAWVYDAGDVQLPTGMCFFPVTVFDYIKDWNGLGFLDILMLYFQNKLTVYQIEGSWFDLGQETVLDAFTTREKNDLRFL